MVQLVIGVAGLLFVIGSATLQSTSVYIDDKALFFVVALAFFYTLAIGGDRWKMIGNFGESALMAGLLGFFIGLAAIAAMDDPPAAATQVAIITLIYGYTIKFVCDVLAKKYGD